MYFGYWLIFGTGIAALYPIIPVIGTDTPPVNLGNNHTTSHSNETNTTVAVHENSTTISPATETVTHANLTDTNATTTTQSKVAITTKPTSGSSSESTTTTTASTTGAKASPAPLLTNTTVENRNSTVKPWQSESDDDAKKDHRIKVALGVVVPVFIVLLVGGYITYRRRSVSRFLRCNARWKESSFVGRNRTAEHMRLVNEDDLNVTWRNDGADDTM